MFKRIIQEDYKVPADVNYLGEMRDFITRVGRKYGVAERIINTFKLAIDEAGTNIIRHAYRDWEGFITIRLIIRDKSVTVSLIDQGHTFDPNRVRDPDLQRYVDIGKKGGLGIFIIRRVIDGIDYRKTVEGNELRLTKHRKIMPRRHFILPHVSVTMKTRYSLIASMVFTVLVLPVFFLTYIKQNEMILQRDLKAGRALARSLTHSSLDKMADKNAPDLYVSAVKFQRDHAPLVTEVIIVDTADIILGALRTDSILEKFNVPSEPIEIGDGILHYRTPGGKEVYDLVEVGIQRIAGISRRVGAIHLFLDKDFIDGEVQDAKKRQIMIFGFILLLGYMGVFILVYMTMSPFKKLANWVRALGRDEAREELEFDTSDEVGEIAKAFNEITEKFRKSQESLAEQERLQKEMQVAQEIQQTLLPAAFPEIEGFEIASYYEAAKDVGGDYFDFVEVEIDTLGIVLADVSGKGVPGSLVMTMIRTALRTEARGNKDAAEVLARVNDFVMNDMKRGMFVTIFYIILDSKRRTINYASAGHNPMILYRGITEKSYYLNPRGFPIGINLPDATLFRTAIKSDKLRLREGDILLTYTDGITEAMNPNRERFGDERMLATIRKNGKLNVDPLVDKIHDEINVFTEGYAQSDDITLVAIKEKMKAEDVLFNFRTRLMHLVEKEGMSVKKACESVGVSTSTYYKYKKRYKKMGVAGLKEKVARSEIEDRHVSIEDKAKIYDIIKEYPKYGAKRISEELNTEKYSYTLIDERRVYNELVRNRLNTRELRQTFIERGGKGKKMKPPGTPFLTLDGQIIMDYDIQKKLKGVEESLREGEISTEPMEIYLPEQSEEEEMGGIIEEAFADKGVFDDREKKQDVQEGVAYEDLGLVEITEETFITKPEREDVRSEEDEGRISLSDVLEKLELNEAEDDKSYRGLELKDRLEEGAAEASLEDELINTLMEEFGDLVEEDQELQESGKGTAVDVTFSEMGEDMEEENLTEVLDEDLVEDRIAASIGDELLGEEMGVFEDYDEHKSLENISPQEEGTVDVVEVGDFDEISVLSDETGQKEALSPEAMRELNTKQLVESGQWFYQQGQYEEAVEEFEKAILEDPNLSEACQYLGDTFFRLGLLNQARGAYEKVKQLDPENVNVLENLGVIFANTGDYKKAVWQWGEVLKRRPERTDIVDRIKKMQRVIRQRCA